MKSTRKLLSLFILLLIGSFLFTACGDGEDEVPTCTTPNLNSIFIGSGSQFVEMESTGTNTWEFSVTNFELDAFSFVFANNASGSNATFGSAPGTATAPNSGTAVQKVVDGTVTCGENAPINLTGLQGQNITITFNSSTLAYNVETVAFDPCTDFSREEFFIRWRNSSNAADFTWAQMDAVDGEDGVFTISQPAANFYLENASSPNFGVQLLEFSNQPDYGGLNNGELFALYRNQFDGSNSGPGFWNFPHPVNGVTSQTARYISVSTRNAQGEETVICPRPADIDSNRGFRLRFTNADGELIVQPSNTLRYVIDTFSAEVAVFIE
ncbi:hypothetical protein [Aquiflexum sp.]|uniref:hypothetical protein n=1 Tax=Aquiflexum sp. TaxID=1872584 RepID=UPI003594178B